MGYLERQYVPHSREILGLPAIADLVVITLDRSQKAEKRFGSHSQCSSISDSPLILGRWKFLAAF